jgi:hypothetical protein
MSGTEHLTYEAETVRTSSFATSLRDANDCTRHCVPWVETHGYRRNVATRRMRAEVGVRVLSE